jgi:hypothetical protein
MIVKELQLPILDVSHHFDSEDLVYDVLVFWNDHLIFFRIEKWSYFIRHVHQASHYKKFVSQGL